MSIGSRLKLLREQKGLSQQGVADQTGVSRSNISKIESDTISPSADAVIALCNFFNVSTDYLLLGKTEAAIASGADNTVLSFVNGLINNEILGSDLNRKSAAKLISILQDQMPGFSDNEAVYPENLNEYEVALIDRYRLLNQRDQGKVDFYVEELLKKGTRRKEPERSSTLDASDEVTATKELA